MKRVTAITVFAAAGVAMAAWAAAAWIASDLIDQRIHGRRTRPEIVLEANHCDLGTVPGDVPLVARFAVRNEGGRRLVVRRESGACCGQTDTNDAILVMPGDSAELVATIDAAGQRGRLEKRLSYTTNDAALPRFELAVSAYIAPKPLDGEGQVTLRQAD